MTREGEDISLVRAAYPSLAGGGQGEGGGSQVEIQEKSWRCHRIHIHRHGVRGKQPKHSEEA